MNYLLYHIRSIMQLSIKINRLAIVSFALFVCSSLTAQQNSTSRDTTKIIEIDRSNRSGRKEDGFTITGTIKEAASGKPLPAINITVPEFSAALTDDHGQFSIQVPGYDATIFISGEGFQSKEIALRGRKNLAASLYEETFNSVYDNVYLPFGTKPRNQAVQAAISANTEGNWNRNIETPDSYLQGKVAGLQATMRSGTPNTGAFVNLRGYNSLYGTNQPLVVVDGVIYDINDYGNSLISGHYTNALAQIDVKDIENITVIKDGVSTYGTKGANGVILITTTHATQQATKIDFAAYAGVNFMPKKLPVMQASDYRVYLSDVLKSRWPADQVQSRPYMNDDPSNPEYYRYHNNTDWQNEVFKNAANSNYYLKVTGGDNIAKYALSMGYLKNAGVTRNTSLTKYNVRFNAELNLSKRLTATSNLSYTYYEQFLKDQGLALKTNPIYLALIKAPILNKNEVSDKGAVSPNLADTDTFGVSNPAAAINNMIDNSKTYRFFGSLQFNYKLAKYITLATIFGITVDEVREQLFIPSKGIANDTLRNAVADNRLGGQPKRIFAIFNDTYADYTRTFNRINRLKVRAGLRYLYSSNEQDIELGYNSATDDFISVGTGANALRRTGGDMGKYSWINTYIGAEYARNDKYFLTVNFAVDGSSRFGTQLPSGLNSSKFPEGIQMSGHNFALMPSIGASWLVSSENFMAAMPAIDMLKLRASFSRTGNDDIGNYTAKQSYVSQNLLGLQGLVRGNIANPSLVWESNNKSNLGLDITVLNERLSMSVDAFKNATSNMITYEPVFTASGYNYVITNSGSMKTKGIDLGINGRLINKNSLKWDIGITIASYKNTITRLPGEEVFTSFGGATVLTKVGSAANLFYGFKTNGVFVSDAEATATGLSKRTQNGSVASLKGGDIKFIDINGDKIIDENDRQVIGNPNPHYFGAFNNKVTWKRLSLEAIFSFTKGNQLYNGVRAVLESASGTNNQLVSVVNRWRADGQLANIPRATWGDPVGNNDFSDRWIEDGSYLRLKMVSLDYALPLKAMKLIKYANIYLTGTNLFTFTKYLGFDPEFQASESILSRGIDIGLEPLYKSIVAGVRIGL